VFTAAGVSYNREPLLIEISQLALLAILRYLPLKNMCVYRGDPVFSSFSACRRGPIRRREDLYTELYGILVCSLVSRCQVVVRRCSARQHRHDARSAERALLQQRVDDGTGER